MTYRHRVDKNQAEIVRAIRGVPGWSWRALPPEGRLGDGLLRANWMPPGMALHIEIKTDKGRLLPHQKIAASDGSIVVIRSFDEAKDLMDYFYRRVDRASTKFTEGTYGVASRGGDKDVVA